jgi:hypothetical protein
LPSNGSTRYSSLFNTARTGKKSCAGQVIEGRQLEKTEEKVKSNKVKEYGEKKEVE